MKKGLIVVNGYLLIPSIEYCVKRLQEEFETVGVQIEIKKSTEILTLIDDGNVSCTLKYDFCIFYDKDFYISNMLEMSGMKVFNNPKAIELCDDKMKTYLALTGKDIPMPKTISGPLNYSGKNNEDFIENLTKVLNFPIVIKENFGSQGSRVYLAKDINELKQIEDKTKFNPRLFQELIQESWGEDYRLIIIGGKYVAGMRRHSLNGDFRSNINLGGAGEIVEMPSSYIELAEKTAKLLNLDYCGVDLLKGKDGPILCEVNSNAFFKAIESVTNINVAKIYVEHILNTINK